MLFLAPMSTLTALVLMLRVVRRSLPWLGGPGAGRPTSVLTYLGSVLLPFMAIYYFDDRYYDDLFDYSNRVLEDEISRTFASLADSIETGAAVREIDSFSRLPWDFDLSFAAAVVGAIVARWLLSRWDDRHRRQWLGIPGAYLELVWMILVTTVTFNIALEWLADRRWGRPIAEAWDLVGAGEQLVYEGAQGWLGTLYATVSAVVLIPIGWLAVGAVVLGNEPPALFQRPAGRRAKQLYEGAERRWQSVPSGLRWAVELAEDFAFDVRGRFVPLARGGWQLIRAGVPPMLLFCLLFVAVQTLADWLWELERWLIGPQDFFEVWTPLTWPMGELNRGIGEAVLVCLLAASIDRVVRVTRGEADAAQPSSSRT